ncbi:group-Specific protein [Bacillus anthracis]|nr:group-Specific protein [Bacillus anthracis]
MIHMLLLKILLFGLIVISKMYVIKFQSSDEANDERGREILYKTNNALYNILYLGILAIIVLQLIDIIPLQFLPDLLLYFALSLSVLGSIFIFINRNSKNY